MISEVKLQHQFATHSLTGNEKKFNTDICEKFDLVEGIGFAVCDGIDGVHGEGGALASKLAIEGVKRHFRKNPVKDPIKALQGALMLANFMVYDHAMKNDRFSEMAVNIIVVLVIDGLIYYASVGTNQLMLQREGVLYQLVKVKEDSSASQIALGREKSARFSLCKNPIQATAGDVILVSSDGLNIGFSDEQIAELLSQDDISVDLLCFQIIYKLEEIGVPDNATLGICRLFDAASLPSTESTDTNTRVTDGDKSMANPFINKRLIIVVFLVLVVAILIIGYKNIFNNVDPGDALFATKDSPEQIDKKGSEDAELVKKEESENKETTPVEKETTILNYQVQKGDTFFSIKHSV